MKVLKAKVHVDLMEEGCNSSQREFKSNSSFLPDFIFHRRLIFLVIGLKILNTKSGDIRPKQLFCCILILKKRRLSVLKMVLKLLGNNGRAALQTVNRVLI